MEKGIPYKGIPRVVSNLFHPPHSILHRIRRISHPPKGEYLILLTPKMTISLYRDMGMLSLLHIIVRRHGFAYMKMESTIYV